MDAACLDMLDLSEIEQAIMEDHGRRFPELVAVILDAIICTGADWIQDVARRVMPKVDVAGLLSVVLRSQ